MKIKNKNILISFIISVVFGILVFLLSNDANGELGASFNSFVKLQFARYFGIVSGIFALVVALIFRLLKKADYTNRLVYIFPGIMNILLFICAIALFSTTANRNMILHDFLLNLLFGVIITADVLLSTCKQ